MEDRSAKYRAFYAGAPDQTCWFAGEGWWLSTAPAPVSTEPVRPHADVTQI